MDSKQIFMIGVIVAALSTVTIATPVMAQNMTGENMTGENMTGKVSGFGPELLSDNTAP
jgi:preprotein translocase subunit SecF